MVEVDVFWAYGIGAGCAGAPLGKVAATWFALYAPGRPLHRMIRHALALPPEPAGGPDAAVLEPRSPPLPAP